MPVSVLILTLNEEANLPACLESVSWCDDVVVLDSYSSDRTVALAEAAGARVLQREFDDFAGQRNYALENVDFAHPWVLHLDADERCTEELRAEIEQSVGDDRYDAHRIASKTMFFGKWLRFAGMYPTYQVRLGRRPGFRFRQVGHGQREDVDPSRIGTLKQPYLHYSFNRGLDAWFQKHAVYALHEAQECIRDLAGGRLDWRGLFCRKDVTRRRAALKRLSFRMPCRPVLRFLYMYLWRRGFLDGRPGWTYCRLLAIYEYMIVVQIKELRHSSHRSPKRQGSSLNV